MKATATGPYGGFQPYSGNTVPQWDLEAGSFGYIKGHNANGGPGTYTVSPSQTVASTTMAEQRTGVFRLDISDQTGINNNHYYVDNIRFTVQ